MQPRRCQSVPIGCPARCCLLMLTRWCVFVQVFARVSPDQKELVLVTLKAAGRCVATDCRLLPAVLFTEELSNALHIWKCTRCKLIAYASELVEWASGHPSSDKPASPRLRVVTGHVTLSSVRTFVMLCAAFDRSQDDADVR